MDRITIYEAAAMLGVHVDTVRRRINEGALTPEPKPPGAIKRTRVYLDRTQVEKLVREGAQPVKTVSP